MTNENRGRVYSFGAFRVDAGERLLFKGDREIPLTPKVFDTLLALIENSSHVLSKKELMQKVWPDSFVEENNLAQNISLLRHKYGVLCAFAGNSFWHNKHFNQYERPHRRTIPVCGHRSGATFGTN